MEPTNPTTKAHSEDQKPESCSAEELISRLQEVCTLFVQMERIYRILYLKPSLLFRYGSNQELAFWKDEATLFKRQCTSLQQQITQLRLDSDNGVIYFIALNFIFAA